MEDQYLSFPSVSDAQKYVARLLANKAVLLIVDDVWTPEEAYPFNVIGHHGRMLLTTRNTAVLVGLGATEYRLDVLSPKESLSLLADWARIPQAELPAIAPDIAQECGYLPLALAMVGSMIRLNSTAWEDALARLKRADLEKIKRLFPDYPYPNLLRALDVSVEVLAPLERERYFDLAVFKEDVEIPEATLQTFWGGIGLNEEDVRELITLFASRSLATRSHENYLKLHDLQVDYVRSQSPDLPSLHGRLVQAYLRVCFEDPASGPNDTYFFRWFPYHLAEARHTERLKVLLFDFRWLEAKLKATDLNAALSDYNLLSDEFEAVLVQRALRLSARILAGDINQLASQLLGRLAMNRGKWLNTLLEGAIKHLTHPFLRPCFPSLIQAESARFFTLEGHTADIRDIVHLDKRRIVSGSADATLRIWDLDSFETLAILRGHAGPINSIAKLGDHRLASSSEDGAILVWGTESHQAIATFKQQGERIVSLIPLSEQFVGSASFDKSMRVWDIVFGKCILRFKPNRAHPLSSVSGIDEYRIVFCRDDEAWIWDARYQRRIRRLRFDDSPITSVAAIDNCKVATGLLDGTILVWDIGSGDIILTLSGHGSRVSSITAMDEHRIVSASNDGDLRVWEVKSGKTINILRGHTHLVNVVTRLGSSHVASASYDGDLRIWEVESGKAQSVVPGHVRSTSGVVLLDDQRVVTSYRNSLQIWEPHSGTLAATPKAQQADVKSLLPLDGQRVVSASSDGSIRLWDVRTGSSSAILGDQRRLIADAALEGRHLILISPSGQSSVWDIELQQQVGKVAAIESEENNREKHSRSVFSVVPLGNELAAVASFGDDVVVFNTQTGKTISRLRGHESPVTAIAALSHNRIVSASLDTTLRIWSTDSAWVTSRSPRILMGHSKPITHVIRLGRQLIASAGEDKTMVSGGDYFSLGPIGLQGA